MIKTLLLACLLLITLSCSTTNWVTEGSSPPPYGVQMGRMFGRGLANVVTAPMEILSQPINRTKGDSFGSWMASFFEGVVMGVVYTGVRSVAGVADILTFYAPHKALVDPEFVTFQFELNPSNRHVPKQPSKETEPK